ncbi:hypothetical protein Xvie_01815 [Xenorhabdus vietnamensis]|uniref:SMI1/KNR4 family protein n=1 Tax=Xenorhabdus vietnamensis TaxID=351656 RepID=A0A1Y2SDM6_9GAMM|nr:hypothetical protein [Xenorhabdus vietnamensis]OTA16718.1 hypothetical protein Xvie_01815 [Xenorhabdus vietnamensis]
MNKLIKLEKQYGEISLNTVQREECIKFIIQEKYQIFPEYLKFITKYGHDIFSGLDILINGKEIIIID